MFETSFFCLAFKILIINNTTLHMACKFGNLKLVQQLISFGMIDKNAKGILSNVFFYSVTNFCLSYFVSKK